MSNQSAVSPPSGLMVSFDLTGKARIRQAALQLFASKGYAQASLRRIAQRAGVSLALIGHHFGSKVLLRDAVDRWLVRTLAEAAAPGLDLRTPLADAALQLARGYQVALDVEPDTRAYLRRAVLDDARGEAQVIAMFLAQTQHLLQGPDQAPRPGSAEDLMHWSAQVFVHVFGPLVLEPTLRRNRALVAEWESERSVPAVPDRAHETGAWRSLAFAHRLPRYIDAGVSPASCAFVL